MRGRSVGGTALLLLALCATAAAAQPGGRSRVGPVLDPLQPIVRALDKPCDRRSDADGAGEEDIVVCGRRDAPRSPYRIPPPPDRFDPASDVDSVSRERNGMLDYGDTGIHSCSTVGPGGYTGCTFKAWKRDREQFGHERPRPRKPR